MIRVLLIYLQGAREIKRLIHPNGVFPIKLAHHPVPESVIDARQPHIVVISEIQNPAESV